MKLNSLIILMAIHFLLNGESLDYGDTLIIHPINWGTPSPEGWNAQYNISVDFPENNEKWAKIEMIHTLKCDSRTKGDSLPCGAWDYIWNTLIKIPNEPNPDIYSIGSFVTPYGKRLILGGEKGWVWTYDITDYAPLLIGEKDITVGNNQELLDLKFLFIKGTPPRNVLKIENIYPYGEYKYSDLSDDIVLKEKTIKLFKKAHGYKIKTIISGHGHEGPRNCCEWDSKTHTYFIDNWEIFRWNVWKDCGNNPLYPQGGTWPFDRAGWCPGTKVDEYNFELTPYVIPGKTISLDYGIEPYSKNGEKNGFFYMTHQLVSYGKPNFDTDVELVDIITPTDKQSHGRFNPDLNNPKILIKNVGKYDLKSLEIHYGLKKRKKTVFEWKGNLEFLDKQIIVLPKPHWNGLKRNQIFQVILKKPNNINDQNMFNNQLTSKILLPTVLPNNFSILIKTNDLNRAKENSFTITDDDGMVLYSYDSFSDSDKYKYSIKLKNGDYQFLFKDQMEDGISLHWWNRSTPEKIGINGEIIFTNSHSDTLHKFNPDFGQEIRFNFHVGPLP
ncbi:MAG: peptide-N-glycosidase F-related protein [Candidatus Neomarinimicrobiota bacterium]